MSRTRIVLIQETHVSKGRHGAPSLRCSRKHDDASESKFLFPNVDPNEDSGQNWNSIQDAAPYSTRERRILLVSR